MFRHQLRVLRRQINRPAINDDDRTVLGAIAAALPRPQRTGWIVTPDTLPRWHRQHITRHWTQPSRGPGRPSTAIEIRRELLDRTIIWNQHQVERLVIDYIDHLDSHRPHRSLDQQPPLATQAPPSMNHRHLRVVKSPRCDGLINEHRNAA